MNLLNDLKYPMVPRRFILPFLLSPLIVTQPTRAETLYVFKEQANNPNITWATGYNTISKAVLASSSGDEIWVVEGVYNESISMTTGISIFGGFKGDEIERDDRDWESNATIVDATGINRSVLTASSECRIDGLTLKNGRSVLGGGIFIKSASFSVANCLIEDNLTEGDLEDPSVQGGGIYISEATVTIQDSTVFQNTSNMGGGIFCGKGSEVIVLDSVINSNRTVAHEVDGGQICVPDYDTGGVYCYPSVETIKGQGGGICIDNDVYEDPPFSVLIVNSEISGNKCRDDGGGLLCRGNGELWLDGCEIRDSFGATGEMVGRGGAMFLESQLLGHTGSRYPALYVSVENSSLSNNRSHAQGGAIFLSRLDLTIENSIIDSNRTGSRGGGIYGFGSGVNILSSTLESNLSEGTSVFGHGGGGCWLDVCDLTVEQSLVSGNTSTATGGAFFLMRCPSVQINRSRIKGNTSVDDAAIYAEETVLSCFNSIIDGNQSTRGGGAFHFISNSEGDLVNCTLANNLSQTGVSGVICENSIVDIANSILWNRGGERSGSQITLSHSCVQGGAGDTSNFYGWPKFMNWKQGDWSLQDGSPCIDRGQDDLLPEDQNADFAGYDRVQGVQIDIGALESPESYTAGSPNSRLPDIYVRADGTQQGDGSSWAEAVERIGDGLFLSSTGSTVRVANGMY
ncbi:MAG: DUF1565 domain-containing protein, partial [Candidatus Omnitrophica bacterium]|nr:DUF1565 domain-containing protein [Candidatus Omnitrophota bacterium]